MLLMQMQQYEYFWCVSNANTIEMEKKKQQIAKKWKCQITIALIVNAM